MSTDSGKLVEVIYPLLVFRNEGAFSLPKAVRERAYIQSLDIQVSSVDWNIYENSKALPNIQFYGYVQLVMQDACTIEVPIKYPRQRVWHIRIEDALSQWRDIHAWHNGSLEWFEWFFRFFTQGEEEAPPLPPIEYPDTNFVESPLREVFVQVKDNCQFEIELTQWEPVPFTGRNAKTYDGKSRQVDGDKDGGLPSGGIQPRRNSSSDPFAGNRRESTLSFENGYFADTGKLSEVVEAYVAPEPPFVSGQCSGKAYNFRFAGVIGDSSGVRSTIPQAIGTNTLGIFIGEVISVEGIRNVSPNGEVSVSMRVVHNGGNTTRDIFVGGYGSSTFIEITSAEFILLGGQGDDCGSVEADDPTQL